MTYYDIKWLILIKSKTASGPFIKSIKKRKIDEPIARPGPKPKMKKMPILGQIWSFLGKKS